jgi:hypothetical protein
VADHAYTPLKCPMPSCGQDLYVRFDHAASLYVGTLNDREPVAPSDADVSTWSVECVDGHRVLVPGESGCAFDHAECSCDVDMGDESRTFRASDLDRLRVVIDQLSMDTATNSPSSDGA